MSVSKILFCPSFIVIACRRFWIDLFANLWQHTELPNSKSDGAIPKQVTLCLGETETRTLLHTYGAENENSCSGNKFYSSTIKDH